LRGGIMRRHGQCNESDGPGSGRRGGDAAAAVVVLADLADSAAGHREAVVLEEDFKERL